MADLERARGERKAPTPAAPGVWTSGGRAEVLRNIFKYVYNYDGGIPLKAGCIHMIGAKTFAGAQKFFEGIREELRAVVWPTREELFGSALVVFVGVSLMATFIGVCDFILSGIAQRLLR